jgi:hypothetical protein
LSFSAFLSLFFSSVHLALFFIFTWSVPSMFNNLLKKASESSFAALASEALDSRPGSPASARRPPGSPLSGPQQQQQQQNGASSPVRKACRLSHQLFEA